MVSYNEKYLDFTRQPNFKDILTNPILDIAARFWESDRYEAFRVCYRSMRIVDDLVDDHKARGSITAAEKQQITGAITGWLTALQQQKPVDEFLSTLIATIETFSLPSWPWKRLSEAMLYDLEHNGFKSFLTFLRYTEGAAIAPASIFMHLCGVRSVDHAYQAPQFDIRKTARPLAIFSYLVHIIRDFEKDQKQGLNYFADNLLARHNLKPEALRVIAQSGAVPADFRNLVTQYRDFGQYYQSLARKTVDGIMPYLKPPYQLSLEIIYSLYSQIFERIDPEKGIFTTKEMNPTPDEVQNRIYETVSSFRPII